MTLELWSLKKITEHYNIALIAHAINQLGWLECYAKRREDSGEGALVVPADFIAKHVKTILQYCHEQCEKVPLKDTIDRIDGDLSAIIEAGRMTNTELRIHIREVRKDILRELDKETFIYIPDQKVQEIRKSISDWATIMQSFEFIKTDVDDHHDCFAAGKNNASVFHLMRVVEWGLRARCIHVGFRRIKSKSKATGEVWVTPIEYTVWETMLGQIQTRVDAKLEKLRKGAAKQKSQELYIPLLQDLRAFKDAWRNHVMHNRTSYAPEDVVSVASHVRRFMLALAQHGINKV